MDSKDTYSQVEALENLVAFGFLAPFPYMSAAFKATGVVHLR